MLTLVEPHELDTLRVPHLGERVRARGMQWIHLPIPDGWIPDDRFEEGWRRYSATLRAALATGERVFVHCKGGLGRAGTIAARLLVELGEAPDAAMKAVRAARRGAIENSIQERYVRGLQALGQAVE